MLHNNLTNAWVENPRAKQRKTVTEQSAYLVAGIWPKCFLPIAYDSLCPSNHQVHQTEWFIPSEASENHPPMCHSYAYYSFLRERYSVTADNVPLTTGIQRNLDEILKI